MFEIETEDRTPLLSDPKLKAAMVEIGEVMKKYDIGGHVILVSPSHSEYKFFFEPTWSAVKYEGEGIRIKATKAELGSQEAVNERTALTAHLLFQMCDLMALAKDTCMQVTVQLAKTVEIVHKPYRGFTPHRDT